MILGITVCVALFAIALWMHKNRHKSIKTFEYEEDQPGYLGSFEHSRVKVVREDDDLEREERYLSWLEKNKEDNDKSRKNTKTKK
jgi:predicted acyl esterase